MNMSACVMLGQLTFYPVLCHTDTNQKYPNPDLAFSISVSGQALFHPCLLNEILRDSDGEE